MTDSRHTEASPDVARNAVIYLKDYTPPDFSILTTALVFELSDSVTTVKSNLSIERANNNETPLVLHGEQLKLIEVLLDGEKLNDENYKQTDSDLTIFSVPEKFELSITTEIEPEKNLSLEGLYLSEGMYCTQCEAEGFRKITYYLDRPDVMSIFTTTIIAEKKSYPVLLSNGNCIEKGEMDGGKHFAVWHDPFKKPCYLFALVAGDLCIVEDQFTTMSGKNIKLQIFVEEKDQAKCDHAMSSLKNAMKWDEQVYGREYDLDLYMIVAVDFFNMGAMENKGLNIFNSSCVLAHPETQTDLAFQRVEAVVAHEYFHNWSGNRVTCRDWFQLSLKEGFTVFRDACFSSDMNSATVKRIEDVSLLRSAQFAEDAGPMSHPVRPESFIEISNFYTLTIYEKGAEVIRMMHQLLGEKVFRKGSDLYFERHDGQAVTCDDFVKAMEDASDKDLTQFKHWYSQAGTPVLTVSESWKPEENRYVITIEQNCPSTPGQSEKLPFYLPLNVALVGKDGLLEDSEQVLIVKEYKESFSFEGLMEKPIPTLLRGFSAPVRLDFKYSYDELLLIMLNETDGFTRWDASQRFLLKLIDELYEEKIDIETHETQQRIKDFCDVLVLLTNQGFGIQTMDDYAKDDTHSWRSEYDAAMLAEMLKVPEINSVMEQYSTIDISKLCLSVSSVEQSIASLMSGYFLVWYERLSQQLKGIGKYKPEANDIALRSLKNRCLNYLCLIGNEEGISYAEEQFTAADNMTDQSQALVAIVASEDETFIPLAEKLLQQFYQQWSHESLVVNQWLTIQVMAKHAYVFDQVKKLTQHEAYDATNPNKVRALVGAFCMRNIAVFHANQAESYEFLANEIIRLNALNPQLAARLLTPLTQWKRYSEPNKTLMQSALKTIAEEPSLSSDVYEVVSKSLA